MNEFFALGKISWYNSIDNEENIDYIVLTNIKDFKDAMSQIEEYYGDDLVKATNQLFEGPFFHVEEEGYNMIEKDEYLI